MKFTYYLAALSLYLTKYLHDDINLQKRSHLGPNHIHYRSNLHFSVTIYLGSGIKNQFRQKKWHKTANSNIRSLVISICLSYIYSWHVVAGHIIYMWKERNNRIFTNDLAEAGIYSGAGIMHASYMPLLGAVTYATASFWGKSVEAAAKWVVTWKI